MKSPNLEGCTMLVKADDYVRTCKIVPNEVACARFASWLAEEYLADCTIGTRLAFAQVTAVNTHLKYPNTSVTMPIEEFLQKMKDQFMSDIE